MLLRVIHMCCRLFICYYSCSLIQIHMYGLQRLTLPLLPTALKLQPNAAAVYTALCRWVSHPSACVLSKVVVHCILLGMEAETSCCSFQSFTWSKDHVVEQIQETLTKTWTWRAWTSLCVPSTLETSQRLLFLGSLGQKWTPIASSLQSISFD